MVVEEKSFQSIAAGRSRSKVKAGEAVNEIMYTCRYLDGSDQIRNYYESRIASGELRLVTDEQEIAAITEGAA
jgi:hypothetical protein